jgi:phosphohistidine phosphatase
MKVLVLVRHAKAAPDAPGGDRARPLTEAGLAAAGHLGAFLGASGLRPDLLLCSPATRAVQTLDHLVAAAGWAALPRREGRFYESTPSRVLSQLGDLPDGVGIALAVGHEPTWSALASLLAGGGAFHLPTGAAVALRLHVERWADVAPGCGDLRWLVPPKLLRRDG